MRDPKATKSTGLPLAEVRDGIETLAEPADIALAVAFDALIREADRVKADADLDEALRETFPASDPIASGHAD